MGRNLAQQAQDEVAENQEIVSSRKKYKVTKTRAHTIVALKLSGLRFSQIAEIEELPNAAVARKIFEDAIGGSVDEQDREQARALTGMRLERLMQSAWGRALNGKDPEQLAFMRTVLSIMDRHVNLYGLNAPSQLEVTNIDASQKEEMIRELIQQAKGPDLMEEEEDIIDATVVEDDD